MRPLFFAAHLCLFVKMWDCVEFLQCGLCKTHENPHGR
mgnify:CR=1 FL=1